MKNNLKKWEKLYAEKGYTIIYDKRFYGWGYYYIEINYYNKGHRDFRYTSDPKTTYDLLTN